NQPGIRKELRGTYAGVAEPVIIDHLTKLGVTAVELLPVHQFVNDSHLAEQGLSNYWGYNTIGFLAPHNAYSSAGSRGQQTTEFKAMVKALHEAGIEVILDVVYNHTAEGNEMGPTIAFRGIDNAAYYRLVDGGYQVGNFPPLWTEWNGKYRDTVRDYWRGEPASLAEFASRITGSSDLYAHSDRRPTASINFIVAHDGFTLRDLVSYNEKHNEA